MKREGRKEERERDKREKKLGIVLPTLGAWTRKEISLRMSFKFLYCLDLFLEAI